MSRYVPRRPLHDSTRSRRQIYQPISDKHLAIFRPLLEPEQLTPLQQVLGEYLPKSTPYTPPRAMLFGGALLTAMRKDIEQMRYKPNRRIGSIIDQAMAEYPDEVHITLHKAVVETSQNEKQRPMFRLGLRCKEVSGQPFAESAVCVNALIDSLDTEDVRREKCKPLSGMLSLMDLSPHTDRGDVYTIENVANMVLYQHPDITEQTFRLGRIEQSIDPGIRL